MTTTFFHACIINTFLWRFQHREYCARRTNSYQSRSSKIFSFVEKCTFETSNILGLFSAAWTHCVKSPNFVQKLIFVFIVFENHIEILKTWSLRSNSVTRRVNFDRTKIGGKCLNAFGVPLYVSYEFPHFLLVLYLVLKIFAPKWKWYQDSISVWWRCFIIKGDSDDLKHLEFAHVYHV